MDLTLPFYSLTVSMITAFLLVPLLCQHASSWGLTDAPTNRKQHSGNVPVIGGLAIFCALAVTVLLLARTPVTVTLLSLGFIMVVLGVIDDRISIKPMYRIPVQVLTTLAMIQLTGLQIFQVGDLIGNGQVQLVGWVSILFTVMCTVGVINSINMIDGLDGLSGSLLVVSLAALLYLAIQSQFTETAILVAAILGALLGFLYFNARIFRNKAKTFLGDAGSMLLGFLLLAIFLQLTQGQQPAPLSAVGAGFLFGLPLMDTVSVMVSRIFSGRSPFAAGRDHLHHQLIDAGHSVNSTVKIMVALHSVLVLLGLITNASTHLEPYAFWGFVALVITHRFCTAEIIRKLS